MARNRNQYRKKEDDGCLNLFLYTALGSGSGIFVGLIVGSVTYVYKMWWIDKNIP